MTKNKIGYVIGSLIVAGAMFVIIPKLITTIAKKSYKRQVKRNLEKEERDN